MKKLALIFFGICYLNIDEKLIDYRNSLDNYKKYIFDNLKKNGFEIDIYFCTNIVNELIKKEIISTFNPKKYSFIKLSRNYKIRDAVKSCIDSKIIYNNVLVIRFDLLFKKKLFEFNIELNKFNIVYKNNLFICDNFYLFPYQKIKSFYNMLCKNINIQSHNYDNDIKSFTEINYLNNNNNITATNNPVYCINRNNNEINKYNFMNYSNFLNNRMIILNIIKSKEKSMRNAPINIIPPKIIPPKIIPPKIIPAKMIATINIPKRIIHKILLLKLKK
jgi:hypothetical protein